jgi:hypothetical protein
MQNSVPEPSGCLLWRLSVDKDGYGHIRFRGKNDRTHRVIWKLHFGDIPKGLCVCHSCDTPACNNIQHYWLGTNAENTYDRTAKGRGVSTEENRARGLAQFASLEARAAMSRAKNGKAFVDQNGRIYQTYSEAAAIVGVNTNSIGRVLRKERPHTKGFTFSFLEPS